MEYNKNELIDKFINSKLILNLNILKCFKLVFSVRLLKSVGRYIIFAVIILFLISGIYFYVKGYKLVFEEIEEILIIKKKQNYKKNLNYDEYIKKNISDINTSSEKNTKFNKRYNEQNLSNDIINNKDGKKKKIMK